MDILKTFRKGLRKKRPKALPLVTPDSPSKSQQSSHPVIDTPTHSVVYYNPHPTAVNRVYEINQEQPRVSSNVVYANHGKTVSPVVKTIGTCVFFGFFANYWA